MPNYTARFVGKRIGPIGLGTSATVRVAFTSELTDSALRVAAFDALHASGAYDTHEHFALIGLTHDAIVNREGLTLAEWLTAARCEDSPDMRAAWRHGVDPSEYL